LNSGSSHQTQPHLQAALKHYKAAAEDPEMESIASANYALAAFEMGADALAVREARLLLRR